MSYCSATNKEQHTKAMARTIADRQRKRRGGVNRTANAYRCDKCLFWHVGAAHSGQPARLRDANGEARRPRLTRPD